MYSDMYATFSNPLAQVEVNEIYLPTYSCKTAPIPIS